MLVLLKITKFALIDELEIEFASGLNLLTGETGSGKSIIVDALGLLTGARTSADLIKAGAERSFVEGIFSIEHNPETTERLRQAGIDREGEEDELLVRRELSAGGRNRIFINNQLATLSLLRDLQPYLVDIHGQGDQQTLYDPGTHLDILDAFAALGDMRRELDQAYARWCALDSEFRDMQKNEAERLQLADILHFQINELESASLVTGEEASLEEERRRLKDSEKLARTSAEAFSQIYEDELSALARIAQAAHQVQSLSGYDSKFREYEEGLESARLLIEDLAFTLREFSQGLSASPGRLTDIENRLVLISRMCRKYGGSIESALDHLIQLKERLYEIESSDERRAELAPRLQQARSEYLELATHIQRLRIKAAGGLQLSVERELSGVAMQGTRFEVRISGPTDGKEHVPSAQFTRRGIGAAEFFFSANPGEAPRPLSRIASGGEASRLMLVLKTLATPAEMPRTIVFDEIDTGIGGRAAEAVGMKLKKLSQTNQVLCVTHQPQIARFADTHICVRKLAADEHTEIRIETLDRRDRVEEIARMLTGSSITEAARRHAREMLKNVNP